MGLFGRSGLSPRMFYGSSLRANEQAVSPHKVLKLSVEVTG